MGGVVVLSGNAIFFIDQSGRKLGLGVNGWASRISDMPMQSLSPEELSRDLHLEGSFAVFIEAQTFLLISRDGIVYPVEIVRDGRTATRLALGPATSQTTIPSMIKRIQLTRDSSHSQKEDVILVGSINGPTVLLKATMVEEEIPLSDSTMQEVTPSVIADNPMNVDIDDDEGMCLSVCLFELLVHHFTYNV